MKKVQIEELSGSGRWYYAKLQAQLLRHSKSVRKKFLNILDISLIFCICLSIYFEWYIQVLFISIIFIYIYIINISYLRFKLISTLATFLISISLFFSEIDLIKFLIIFNIFPIIMQSINIKSLNRYEYIIEKKGVICDRSNLYGINEKIEYFCSWFMPLFAFYIIFYGYEKFPSSVHGFGKSVGFLFCCMNYSNLLLLISISDREAKKSMSG